MGRLNTNSIEPVEVPPEMLRPVMAPNGFKAPDPAEAVNPDAGPEPEPVMENPIGAGTFWADTTGQGLIIAMNRSEIWRIDLDISGTTSQF